MWRSTPVQAAEKLWNVQTWSLPASVPGEHGVSQFKNGSRPDAVENIVLPLETSVICRESQTSRTQASIALTNILESSHRLADQPALPFAVLLSIQAKHAPKAGLFNHAVTVRVLD
jgi:hypothetical protein